MEVLKGSITEDRGDYTEESLLFTYSEEERQRQEINESNARLVFLPEFIPYYPQIRSQYDLSDIETLIYGFIRFYLTNSSDRFYFTNEQLAELFNKGTVTISQSVKALSEKGLIKTGYKIKAGGGQIRFISDIQKSDSPTFRNHTLDIQKLNGNKNKINKNKINNIANEFAEIEKDNPLNEINTLIAKFEVVNPSFKRLFSNKSERGAMDRLINEHTYEKIEKMLDKLPDIVNMPYAPKITTPVQLERDLGKLILFMKQNQGIGNKTRGGYVDARGF